MANLPLALMHLPGYYAYVDEDGDVLTDMVAKEAMEVAHALGYAVCWEDIAQVKQKAIDTKYVTLNSCSYDVKNKCSTEVEFLNGAIVKMGKKVGVPTPVNETLVRMMRCVERTYAYQF